MPVLSCDPRGSGDVLAKAECFAPPTWPAATGNYVWPNIEGPLGTRITTCRCSRTCPSVACEVPVPRSPPTTCSTIHSGHRTTRQSGLDVRQRRADQRAVRTAADRQQVRAPHSPDRLQVLLLGLRTRTHFGPALERAPALCFSAVRRCASRGSPPAPGGAGATPDAERLQSEPSARRLSGTLTETPRAVRCLPARWFLPSCSRRRTASHARARAHAPAADAATSILPRSSRTRPSSRPPASSTKRRRHTSDSLQLQPQSVEALSNLGVVLVQLGRYDEAIASYGKRSSSRT